MGDIAQAFEDAWNELRPRLERMLLRSGVQDQVVDDVIQETAIRLLRNWDRLDTDQPLWPLTRTIARNCLADAFRGPTMIPVAELPDHAAAYELEEHGLARARLSRVQSALRSLDASDRSVLLAEVGVGPRAQNSSASKMARQRARRKLVAAMDRVAAAFSGVPISWRRLHVWLHSQPHSDLQAAGSSGTAVIAAVSACVVVLSSGGPSVAGRHPHHRHPATLASRSLDGPPGNEAVTSPRSELGIGTESHAAQQPPPPAPEASEETIAEAGPAHAKSGEGKGHRYVGVCTGKNAKGEDAQGEGDEIEASVTVYDGNQDGDGDDRYCS